MTRFVVAAAVAVAASFGGAAHASTCVTVNGLLVVNQCTAAHTGQCVSRTAGRPGATVTVTSCGT